MGLGGKGGSGGNGGGEAGQAGKSGFSLLIVLFVVLIMVGLAISDLALKKASYITHVGRLVLILIQQSHTITIHRYFSKSLQ